jgi:hypothetical protein
MALRSNKERLPLRLFLETMKYTYGHLNFLCRIRSKDRGPSEEESTMWKMASMTTMPVASTIKYLKSGRERCPAWQLLRLQSTSSREERAFGRSLFCRLSLAGSAVDLQQDKKKLCILICHTVYIPKGCVLRQKRIRTMQGGDMYIYLSLSG